MMRGRPVMSPNRRQPKLQMSRDLWTVPVRANSGVLKPVGVRGFLGGSVRKYAVQGVRHVSTWYSSLAHMIMSVVLTSTHIR